MIKLDSKYKEDLMFMIKKYEETFVAPYYCFSKNELLEVARSISVIPVSK